MCLQPVQPVHSQQVREREQNEGKHARLSSSFNCFGGAKWEVNSLQQKLYSSAFYNKNHLFVFWSLWNYGKFQSQLRRCHVGRLLRLASTGIYCPHLYVNFLFCKSLWRCHHHFSHSTEPSTAKIHALLFVAHLSSPDLCFTSSTVPQLLLNLPRVDWTSAILGV